MVNASHVRQTKPSWKMFVSAFIPTIESMENVWHVVRMGIMMAVNAFAWNRLLVMGLTAKPQRIRPNYRCLHPVEYSPETEEEPSYSIDFFNLHSFCSLIYSRIQLDTNSVSPFTFLLLDYRLRLLFFNFFLRFATVSINPFAFLLGCVVGRRRRNKYRFLFLYLNLYRRRNNYFLLYLHWLSDFLLLLGHFLRSYRPFIPCIHFSLSSGLVSLFFDALKSIEDVAWSLNSWLGCLWFLGLSSWGRSILPSERPFSVLWLLCLDCFLLFFCLL